MARLLWSDVAQAPLADLFQLQDALTTRIVSSLRLPLSARDRRALDQQAPGSAEAYELYMRANQLMTDSAHWQDACALYEKAVQLDPGYAPAWAQLGRVRRVLAKWGGEAGTGLLPLAQAAFARALDLDPDFPSRSTLGPTWTRSSARRRKPWSACCSAQRGGLRMPASWRAWSTICRYAGLLGPSLAAHGRAVASRSGREDQRLLDALFSRRFRWSHSHRHREPAFRRTVRPPGSRTAGRAGAHRSRTEDAPGSASSRRQRSSPHRRRD